MTEFGEAALNFIKGAGEIDPQITSYRDFPDILPLLKTYYKLFHKHPDDEDESMQIRSMVRFLQMHVSKDIDISIDLEKLINLDFDEIEKLAILMFNCMKNDEHFEDYQNLMAKLDETDRDVLIGAQENGPSSNEELETLSKQMHEFTESYIIFSKLNAEFDELVQQYNTKSGSVDQIVAEEEKKLKESHSNDKFKLEQLKIEISALKDEADNSESILVPEEEEMDRLYSQKETLTHEVQELKSKVESLKSKTQGIEELRLKQKEVNEETEPLRQEYHNLLQTVENINKSIDQLKNDYQVKNADLIKEVAELKEKKENTSQQINSNREALIKENSEGETRKMVQSIQELRKKRDELKQQIKEKMSIIEQMKQSLSNGDVSKLNI